MSTQQTAKESREAFKKMTVDELATFMMLTEDDTHVVEHLSQDQQTKISRKTIDYMLEKYGESKDWLAYSDWIKVRAKFILEELNA